MTALSRREFGRIVVIAAPFTARVGAPFAALAGGSTAAAAASVLTIGVSTSSFRDLPREMGSTNVDDVIRALKAVRATRVELAFANIEPAPPSTSPFMGGTPAYPTRVVFSPQQIAYINAQARTALREWRAQTEPRYFDEVRSKFAAAGLTLIAGSLAYDASFTDDEIEATFRQAKALGITTVSSPMTLATAARLVPYSERHRIAVAIHNETDGNAAGAIATPQIADALALSASFKLKLDIGNVTASNGDAVAVLRRHEARVSHVLVRDRLRNGGGSQHLGEGDTPITGVLSALKASSFAIPAVVEHDYVGVHSSVDEVTASIAYLSKSAT